MSTAHGMVLPPVDPITGAIEPHRAEYEDVRIPTRLGRFSDDERDVHPLGHYKGDENGPCAGERWGRQRHLFDVLHTHGGQGYTEDMTALPVEFGMVLTCVRCGLVLAMRGQAHSDENGGVRGVAQVDPVPLQAGELLAQQTRHEVSGWGNDHEHWFVYRNGERVGFIATTRGQRGRRYVHGRIGDDGPLVEGPTALAVLRKLSRLSADANLAAARR